MTSVNVTTNKNTITVQEGDATTVTVSTVGPQGPQGVSGVSIIGEGTITEAKLDIHAAPSGTNKFLGYTANGMEWAVPPDTDTTYSVGDNGLTKNNFTDALKTKLDGIEASATADMTGSEIKTAYEAESDTNAFTDALKTKLEGVESGSTGDMTGAEIKSAYESESDTNAFTDSEKTKLSGIATGAEVNVNTTYSISCVDGDNTDEEKIRLTAGGDGSGTDDVVLEAGTGLSIARSGDKITFTNTVTDTNTQLTTEEVQDIIGAMVSSNTETNISVTYDDTNGKLDFVSTDTNTTYSVGDGGLTQNNFTNTLKTKLDGIASSANNYVHPNHSGEVTSSADGATVIASNIVDEDNLKISNSPSNGTFLQYKDGTDELTWATPTDTNTTYTAGTGLNLSGTEFSVTSIALTTVQEAANESAQLSLTTQEGDVVVRTDENKTYVKNAGTAGTMADFTLLRTPTDAVLSVNGNTGAITAAQIASAVEAASDSNTFTDADHTKLDGIEASATADQTGAEIKTAYEAESDTNAYTDAEKTKLAGVEASATADQTDAEIRAAVEAASDSNVFTDADHTKLNAIEASATADQTAAEIKTLLDSDGIVNAQVDASAAIAGTKISPDFGSQNITTSGNVTIDGNLDLGDNDLLRIGNGDDITIYHDGSHSVIKNITGSLYAATGAFLVQNAAQTESQIISSENNSVDLYFDNVKRFETSNEGTLTTGDAVIQDDVYLSATSTISSRLVLSSSNATSWTGGRDLVALDLIGNGADHRTGNLSIKIKKAAADASPTEMMRIDGTYNKIRIPDSVQYELGDGGDLKLYHDATDSRIDNSTGYLTLRSNQIALQNAAGDHDYVKCPTNEQGVELFYDNSKKFQTTANGVKVIGASNSPNDADWASASSITTSGSYGGGIAMIDGSAGFVQYCEASGANWWLESGADDAAPETNIKASHNGAVFLYYDHVKRIESTSYGALISNKLVVGSGNNIDTTVQINTEDTDKDALTLSNWDGSTTTNKVTIHFDSSGIGGWNIGMPAATDSFVIENDGGAVALTIDGSNNATFAGAVSIADKVTQTSTAVSALDIDCSTSNYFTKAISADSTFTFSNVPSSGEAYGFVLELDVSGDRTLTWPAAVKWAGGSAPTLTASKTHLFSLVTVDNGTTWRGSAAVDFTT